MKLKEFRNKQWFKIVSNPYVLAIVSFIIWMFFFDGNSYLVHRELDKEIDKLEKNRDYFKHEITHDSIIKQQLEDSIGLEKYAREQYHMKRPNEEVYIIEYEDSVQ